MAKKAPKDSDYVAKSDADLLQLSLERWKINSEGESSVRERMLRDQKISVNISGDELWSQDAISERQREKRPRISIDRFAQPIHTLVNQHRQSGSGIKYSPVDEGADEDTARALQGIARNIETQSRARLSYAWAFEHAVRMGRGFIRIVPEYVNDNLKAARPDGLLSPSLFEQDLRIRRVVNPFTVYPDVGCTEPDYSDATCYHIIEDLLPSEYKLRYGDKSEYGTLDNFAGIGHRSPLWFPGNGKRCRVAEYFYADDSLKETVVLIGNADGQPLAGPDGQAMVVLEKQLRELSALLPPDVVILKKRKVTVRQIKWVKHNALEVLERTDVPGKFIPIIPTIGEEFVVDGERDLRGIVRGAIDAVKTYSYEVTSLVEHVGMTPKQPYIIAVGQVTGYESFWGTANTKNWGFLPYKVVDAAGRLVPPPQRSSVAPAIQGLVAAIIQADNDVKASTMHWDPSLGKEGPEQSGRAILARQQQGDIATAHYGENFRDITLTHIGRILMGQIPHYYDTQRVIRILGEDEKPKTITLNTPFQKKDGTEGIYRFDVGRYDVVAEDGPGYKTKQQETRELLQQTIQAVPEIFPKIAPHYFKSLGLHDIAALFKPAGEDGEELSPEQLMQMVEQLKAEREQIGQAMAELEKKAQGHEMKAQVTAATKAAEIEAKADSAEADRQSKERTQAADRESKEQIAAVQAEIELMKLKLQAQQSEQQQQSQAVLSEVGMILKHIEAMRGIESKAATAEMSAVMSAEAKAAQAAQSEVTQA